MATKKKVAAKKVKGGEKKKGVGAYIQEKILTGWGTERILEGVAKQFPDSDAKATTVSWHRSKLRREGHDIPRAVTKKDKKAA